jgi:hypothetical protein
LGRDSTFSEPTKGDTQASSYIYTKDLLLRQGILIT